MINGNIKIVFSVLVLLKFRTLYAQQVPNTNSNQGVPPSSGPPGFFDPGSMGPGPNFGSGRFGNPTSNYPANAFFPFGNQNNQPGSGPGLQNPNFGNLQNRPIQGYPNQQGNPYQGNNMNPNYQRPNNQNPNAGNFQNRPSQVGLPNQGPPFQGASPNYQGPPYPNIPNDVLSYPNVNRPYQNGGMPLNQNQNYPRPMPGQFLPGQFPAQNGQYPSQGNNNFRPGVSNPNFRPDTIYFPGETSYQNQPDQFYPQNNFPNQNGQNFGPSTPSNVQPNYSNNFPGSNGQVPISNNPGATVNVPPGSTLSTGNFNPAQPQMPNTNDPDYNGTVAILGKPVILPPTTVLPGQPAFDVSTEDPTQKKCVQDCPSTSEYAPVCGSNNVTYINPGKLVCAQKCGEGIYLYRTGRCPGDIPSV